MNNLNDPDWNIKPNNGENGSDRRWCYALLVPLLSVAVFRWAWVRESKKEITEAKKKNEREIETYKQDIKTYKADIVNLKNNLSLEREAVAIYKKEREDYYSTLDKEGQWEESANKILNEVDQKLMKRQEIYCSLLTSKDSRLKIERQLLQMAGRPPLARLQLQDGLIKIFEEDKFCASYFNDDRRNNGRLRLEYMEFWRRQVACLKHEKAEVCLKAQPSKK